VTEQDFIIESVRLAIECLAKGTHIWNAVKGELQRVERVIKALDWSKRRAA
jgi:hypothetical protein